MSYDHTASIHVTNNTGAKVNIKLANMNDDNMPVIKQWNNLAAGASTDGWDVGFNTGAGSGRTYWWVQVTIKDGPNKGYYYCNKTASNLESSDAGESLYFSLHSDELKIVAASGTGSLPLTKNS